MRRQTMSKRDFIRSLLAVVLILGLGLAPVGAQAAPNLAGDSRDGSIWDVFAPVLQLWEAFWGHNDTGPSVDPTSVSRKLRSSPHGVPTGRSTPASPTSLETARSKAAFKASR
jgi:hypothetical protein